MALTGTITRNSTLPNSADKADFYNLVDTATIAIGGSQAASDVDLSVIAQSISMNAKDITEAKAANVASHASGTTTIWVTDGNFLHITGTNAITSFGTAQQAGDERTIVFDDALTLTHNATSLILPGGANITTAAGDRAIVRAETTANARVIVYTKADGTAVVDNSVTTAAAQSDMETATSTTLYVSPGRTQYHPGVGKAWVKFDGSAASPITKDAGHNISGTITKSATGIYVITWTTAFSSAHYSLTASAIYGGSNDPAICGFTTQSTTSCTLRTVNSEGADVDSKIISVIAFGDQ